MESTSHLIRCRINKLKRLKSRKETPPKHLFKSPSRFSVSGSSPTLFNRLPVELLIMILAPLPLSSVASLAIANRHMLCTVEEFFHPFALLRTVGNELERAHFLQHFEARHPDEYLCHACGAFHPRSVPSSAFSLARQNHIAHMCPKHREEFPEKLSLCGWDIHWLTFHKTMRAYRYTTRHGNAFNLNRFKSVERGWSHETMAIPVSEHLLLRYRYSRCLQDPAEAFTFGNLFYELCPHIQHMQMDAEGFNAELRDAMKRGSALPLKDIIGGYRHSLRQCRHCPTEVLVHIHAGSLYPGRTTEDARVSSYIISVTRYMDIGECRSPFEVEWRAITTRTPRARTPKGRRTLSWYVDTNSYDVAPLSNEWSERDFTSHEPLHVVFERQLA